MLRKGLTQILYLCLYIIDIYISKSQSYYHNEDEGEEYSRQR